MGDKFLSLIEKATDVDLSKITMPEQSDFDNLDKQHHSLWTLARNEHQNHNYQLAQYRKESLLTSHKARMNILAEQLNNASEDKISRMKQSEINRAEADFQRRMAEIQKAETQADISAQPVAFGVVIIE